MPPGRRHPVLRFIRRLAQARTPGEASDGSLLRRFAAQRDEAAFAILVQRHGPMVLSVCRRVLNDDHGAEDAFQATFLVLVKKAGTLRRPELLANWLFGVAYRTAMQARGILAKRRAHEQSFVDIPAPEETPDLVWREVRQVLDEEVNRLPIKYRAAFVLCCMEGVTKEQAAQLLGCPTGTVISRLSRARERLRRRLTRRGITVSGAALAGMLSAEGVSAAVPAVLAGAVVESALAVAAGRLLATGVVSQQVWSLTQGVLHAMFTSKLKTLAVFLFVLGVALGGSGSLVYFLAARPPAPAGEEKQPAAESGAKLKALLKERFEVAREEFAAQKENFDKGTATLEFVCASSRRVLEAQRALADNHADRIAVPEGHWDRMKEVERLCAIRHKAKRISTDAFALARYNRLEAEIWLEEAKGK